MASSNARGWQPEKPLRTDRLRTLLALGFLGSLLSGCGHPAQTLAAHKIADALPAMLGPAAHYDVQVEGDPFALSRGRARRIVVTGEGVQLAPTVVLDTLILDARDLSFDPGARQLQKAGSTTFAATMSQAHLTAYLAQVKTRIQGLSVTLGRRDAEAEVPVSVAGLQTTVRIRGTLAPGAGGAGSIDVVANRARVGLLPVPAGLVNLALREVNPLVDLSSLKVPVTVTQAEVADGRIVLHGTAQLPTAQ